MHIETKYDLFNLQNAEKVGNSMKTLLMGVRLVYSSTNLRLEKVFGHKKLSRNYSVKRQQNNGA